MLSVTRSEKGIPGGDEGDAGNEAEGLSGRRLVESGREQPGEQGVGGSQHPRARDAADRQRQRGLAQQRTMQAVGEGADTSSPVTLGDVEVLEFLGEVLRGDQLEKLLTPGDVVVHRLAVDSEAVGDRL